MAEKKSKKTPGKPVAEVKRGPNTVRPNGKAWKRRVCGDRHNPDNCSKCKAIYSARHNRRVAVLRNKKIQAALDSAPEVGYLLTKSG